MNTRAIAAQIIRLVHQEGYTLKESLVHSEKTLHPSDRAYIQTLAFGVLRWYPRLSFIMDHLITKPIRKQDSIVKYLIAVGLFQIIFLQTPTHAAIYETVEAAKDLNKPWATGLVNAILRSYLRQKENLDVLISSDIEARTAHPLWLYQVIKQDWPEHWEDILEQNNMHPPLHIRVNTSQYSRENYLEQLHVKDIEAHAIEQTKNGISLDPHFSILGLPQFSTGACSVQDASSQRISDCLSLSPHLQVLDACAAPGGKTTLLLEQEPSLHLTALDISPDRLQTLQENLTRLGLKAKTQVANACRVEQWWDKTLFDRILIDAPCSGTGVIRRHPDIKYLKSTQQIKVLNQKQFELLESLWSLLKPEGLLLYTTCSILKEENEAIINRFLASHPHAHCLPIPLSVGFHLSQGHQVLPGQGEGDGFYYALLQKTM